MAKKSRRARLSPTQRYIPTPGGLAPNESDASTARPAQSPRAAPGPGRGSAGSRLGQNPEDYAHIYADLKRIGILAASILAVLIVLRIAVFY